MTANAIPDRLIRQLQGLLPIAAFSLVDERPWHSLTFAGTRLRLSARLSGGVPADVIADFARTLADYEFDLDGRIVAEIAVTECGAGDVLIEALLLDD